MVAQAYQDPNCYIGLILGTGSNAAYMENIAAIGKWKSHTTSDKMAINMEWGGFDSIKKQALPYTKFDKTLDSEAKYPGQQLYEKMLSGLYLGEIARLILIELIKGGELFSGNLSPNLNRDTFTSQNMSNIEVDDSENLDTIKSILEGLAIRNSTLADRRMVKEACHLVAERAAKLSAVGIAAIIRHINKLEGCTVAVDGSVFNNYPFFPHMQKQALVDLFGDAAQNIRFVSTTDGSGNGAALIAAIAN